MFYSQHRTNDRHTKVNRFLYDGHRSFQSATSEYLTSCIVDLGKTRSNELALGVPNRTVANDYTSKIVDIASFYNHLRVFHQPSTTMVR